MQTVTAIQARIFTAGLILIGGLLPVLANQHAQTLAPVQLKVGNKFVFVPRGDYVDVLKDGGGTWVLSLDNEVPKASLRLIPITTFNVPMRGGRHRALDGKIVQLSRVYRLTPNLLVDHSTLVQPYNENVALPVGMPVRVSWREEGYYVINFDSSLLPEQTRLVLSGLDPQTPQGPLGPMARRPPPLRPDQVLMGRVPVSSVYINAGQQYTEEDGDPLPKREQEAPPLTLSIPLTVYDSTLRDDIRNAFDFNVKYNNKDNAKRIADDPAAQKFDTKCTIADALESQHLYSNAGRWQAMKAEQLIKYIPELEQKFTNAIDNHDEKSMKWLPSDIKLNETVIIESLQKVSPENRKQYVERWYELMDQQLQKIPDLEAKANRAMYKYDIVTVSAIAENVDNTKKIIVKSVQIISPLDKKISIKCDWLDAKQKEEIRCVP